MPRRPPHTRLWILLLLLLGEALAFALLVSPPSIQTKPRIEPVSRALGPGERIDQETKADDVFDLKIALGEGQVLSADLRPIDTDLSAVLFNPAGMPILSLESSSGLPAGPLIAVAATTGQYRLRVRAHYPGRFSLYLSPFHQAEGADHDRAAAALLVAQASFNCRRKEGSAGEAACLVAMTAFDAALARWRPEQDRREIALTHYWLGRAWERLGDSEKARASYEEAQRWFLAAGDHAAAAVAEEGRGESFYHANEYTLAREAFGRAREKFHHTRNRAGEAAALGNRALVERSLGKFQEALDDYKQALGALEALGRRSDQAVLLANLGTLYVDLEEPKIGLEYLQRALAIQPPIPGREADALLLVNIGLAHADLGSTPKALESLSAGLELARESGSKHTQLTALSGRAFVHLEAGHTREAARDLEEALPLARQLGSRKDEGAVFGYLTQLHILREDYGKALADARNARRLFQAIGDRRSEAKSLFGIATIERQMGRGADALASIEESIALGESLRAEVLNGELRTSIFGSVRPRFELAAELLTESGASARAFEVSERARARSVLDELAESHADIRGGVASELLDKEKDVLAQIQKKETERSAIEAGPDEQRRIDALDVSLRKLLSLRDDVLDQIKARSPRYAALVQPQPRKLQEIQLDLLDRDSLLLSYFLGEKKSFLWVVDRQGLRSVELPGRSRIEDGAKTLWEKIGRSRNRSARTQKDVDAALARLGEMLLPASLGPLAAKRLLIIPDGALQFVPFTALPEPGTEPGTRALVENHEIVELPSASAITLLRQGRKGRHPAPMTIAVFADPVFGSDDIRVHRRPAAEQGRGDQASEAGRLPRLESSREEAEHILASIPPGKSFSAFDFQANLETVRNMELSRFRRLHFATHGTLGSHTKLPGIFLSKVDQDGNTRDNFLSALDIYNLDLNADLVVLSACETALGDDLRGEGVGRLTRAFLYAGAKSVVVSLWSVNDEATAEFMKIFYSAMLKKGLPSASALREAQRTIRREKRWSSPYFWAGFVLQGDWE